MHKRELDHCVTKVSNSFHLFVSWSDALCVITPLKQNLQEAYRYCWDRSLVTARINNLELIWFRYHNCLRPWLQHKQELLSSWHSQIVLCYCCHGSRVPSCCCIVPPPDEFSSVANGCRLWYLRIVHAWLVNEGMIDVEKDDIVMRLGCLCFRNMLIFLQSVLHDCRKRCVAYQY